MRGGRLTRRSERTVTLPHGRVVRPDRVLFDPRGVMVLRHETGRFEELAPLDAPEPSTALVAATSSERSIDPD